MPLSTLPPSVLMYASGYAGLAFGLCEWANGLPFEVKYIWRSSELARDLRWMYLASRYIALLGLVLYPAATKYVSKPSTSRETCMAYWLLQQFTSYTTVTIFLALFAKRVHALWEHDTKIGIFLLVLVTSEYLSNIAIGGISLARVEHYGQDCLFTVHWPKEIVLLGTKGILVQVCLWSLAFKRCASLRQGFGGSQAGRLISRISRETLVATLLYCAVPLVLVADGIWTDLATQVTKMTYVAFPTCVSMTSSATCRMVRNMQVLREKASGDRMAGSEEGIVFTSIPGSI